MLEYYDPNAQVWKFLEGSRLPANAGPTAENLVLCNSSKNRQEVFLVGGKGPLGETWKKCHIFNTETLEWAEGKVSKKETQQRRLEAKTTTVPQCIEKA